MAPNYKNFIYMEEQGFIFAYVPKVACTNWKSLLRYMAGHEDWLDNKLAHDKVHGGLRYLDLDGPDAALLDDPAVRKYAMVRDPYSRVLSAYLNKVESRLPVKPESEGDYWDEVVRDIDRFRADRLGGEFTEITVEVFLRWLKESESPFVADEHWAPQSVLLRQPDVQFEILGRFESLPEDSARMLEAMGCDQGFPSQDDVSFAPTGAQSKVKQYFAPAHYTLVDQIFSMDLEAFDYPHKLQEEPSMTQIIETRPDVIATISKNDWMWKGNKNDEVYLRDGWSVGRSLLGASVLTGRAPKRVLDFGCGHGRVMRWIRALFPEADIVASDRVRDGVDFCAQTFDAIPVYSNDAYEDIDLGEPFNMIWLGSVYTHLPMALWHKLTRMLKDHLAPEGLLIFSYAGPYVAQLMMDGERNQFAEVDESNMRAFLEDYRQTGFGYARHDGVGDREWGRAIISHERLFQFLHDEELTVRMMGERLYANRQDIVAVQPQQK